MSLPLRPHVINRLRANILQGVRRSTTFPISAMGQRLHSQYRIEPVPRDLIPSRGQSKQQILWLGCSDSGYDETTILDLLPDEMIVIRNFGNMALSTDLAWSSAVQHAIDNLQVLFFSFFPKLKDQTTKYNRVIGEAYNCLRALWMWNCDDRANCELDFPLAKVRRLLSLHVSVSVPSETDLSKEN